ncbi:MAG: type 4a pilus biogenesis protein PilO, partial [Candidatus Colwellbacteria bacterium]|nr:type 4a pilus biogenesis protein PilO [Candidatus Colwellbacteria bacterium]
MLLLVAAVVSYSNFVKPVYVEIQTFRDKNEAGKTLLENQKQSIEAVNKLLSQYKSLSQIQDNVSLVLPNEEQVPEIINQLQGIAKINNLKIESLSLQYPPLKPALQGSLIKPLGSVRVTMRLTGEYNNIKSYLEDLQTNIRIIDVNSLSIEGGGLRAGGTL